MQNAVVYIHGKGGNAGESEHYQPLFSKDRVIGFDYYAETPREAIDEFQAFFDVLQQEYDSIVVVANSIGVYFTLTALKEYRIKKAYFISPIVDMEYLILNMMQWAGVSEEELQERRVIQTSFGETLLMDYLDWARKHPVEWNTSTDILYGSMDMLQSIETIQTFAENTDSSLTVMKNGEHWFHAEEQMAFLDEWIRNRQA